VTDALQDVQREAAPGLAVAAGAFGDAAAALKAKERLDLPDDLAAGASRIEDLIKKPPEGAAHRVDALAAIGILLGGREQPSRDQVREERFEPEETLLTHALEAPAERSQARTPLGKEGSIRHNDSRCTALWTIA
jgi:hypothetical protein